MILRFILGSILAIASVIFTIITSGGSPALFATPYALVLSIVVPIGGMLAAYGPGRLGVFLRAIFPRDIAAQTETELLMAKAALRTLTGLVCATGLLGFFLGMLWTLACLAVKAEVGLSFARSLSPVLHGAFIVLWIVLPFSCVLDRRLESMKAGREPGKEAPARILPGKPSYPWILVAFIGLVISFLLLFRDYFWFFDLSSIFVSVILLFAVSMIAISPADIARFFALAYGKKDADAVELKQAAAGVAFLARSSIVTSLFGIALGLVYMLAEWDNKYRVGPCVAVITFSALYGLLILLFAWLPLKAALERKLAEAQKG